MRVLAAAAFEGISPYAHALNTVKMAQGFARNGHDSTLIFRRGRDGGVDQEAFRHHFGLTAPVRLLPVHRRWGTDRRFALRASFTARHLRPQLVYARNFHVPVTTARMGIPTVAESHAHPGSTPPPLLHMIEGTQLPAFRLLVTISERLAENFESLGVPREKIQVLPDAVDIHQFRRPHDLPPSPYEAGRAHAVYTGHLYDYKGIPTVLEAAAALPDLEFHLVGGLPEDMERQRQRIAECSLSNVTLHGHLAQPDLPPYLWHADVLLLPPSADHPSAKWTSPLKLAEYLASGVPVVSSRIPALEDWLTDEETHFFAPDDARDLARAIREALDNRDRRAKMIARGLEMAERFSYTNRARRILEHPSVASALDHLTN